RYCAPECPGVRSAARSSNGARVLKRAGKKVRFIDTSESGRLGGVIGSGELKISWREIPPGNRSTGTTEGDGIRKRGYVRAGGNTTRRNEKAPGGSLPGPVSTVRTSGSPSGGA